MWTRALFFIWFCATGWPRSNPPKPPRRCRWSSARLYCGAELWLGQSAALPSLSTADAIRTRRPWLGRQPLLIQRSATVFTSVVPVDDPVDLRWTPVCSSVLWTTVCNEKSPLTYQFLTFGISPRNMTYQAGIWHISVVWHISQDFDISVRILYRLPLQYKPFCTVFHCSTKPGVFASGTWESHSVPSFTPPPTKLLPFSQTTTRAVTPVAVGRRPLYARQD